jgi:hypothetical protein
MQTATTPQAPPPAAPPALPAPVQVQVVGQTRPITQAEISVLRQQRSEMSNQLSNVQNRREEIVDQIRVAPAGTDVGMREQLKILDERIVRIEQDLELSGRTLRMGQVAVGTTIVPPRSMGPGDNEERAAMVAGMVLVPLLFFYIVARWRRRGRRRQQTDTQTTEQDARMERLEQAVDAIALEIERVGEAQRYQTKVLSEANLMPALNAGQRAADPIRMKEFEELRERR